MSSTVAFCLFLRSVDTRRFLDQRSYNSELYYDRATTLFLGQPAEKSCGLNVHTVQYCTLLYRSVLPFGLTVRSYDHPHGFTPTVVWYLYPHRGRTGTQGRDCDTVQCIAFEKKAPTQIARTVGGADRPVP